MSANDFAIGELGEPVTPKPEKREPTWPKRLPLESMESWTLRVEEATGYDSIATIIEHYSTWDDEGRRTDIYECVFPGCSWRTRNAERMWRHVHEGPKHRPQRLGSL